MKDNTLNITAIDEIDLLAKDYSAARDALAEKLSELKAEVEAATRRRIKAIKLAAAEAAMRKTQLRSAIETHPELFVKPRTMTLHLIKVGYRKGTGKIEWEDDDAVVARIEKFLPEEKDVLIKTTKKPVVDALRNLDVGMLAKLGCTAESTGDVVVIKGAGTDVEKLVAKMLEEGAEEAA